MLPSLKGAVGTTLTTVFAGFAAHRRLKEATVMITATMPRAVARETLKLRDTISLRFLFIEENSLPFSFFREAGPAVYRNWVRISDPFFGIRGATIARIGFRARKLEGALRDLIARWHSLTTRRCDRFSPAKARTLGDQLHFNGPKKGRPATITTALRAGVLHYARNRRMPFKSFCN
jgi:hypothetical protein